MFNNDKGLSTAEFQKFVIEKLDKISCQLEAQREATRELMSELRLKGVDKLPQNKIPDLRTIDYPDGTWTIPGEEELTLMDDVADGRDA